jgi:hypothetical protein
MFAFAKFQRTNMNKATLKSRASLLGKVFESKGVTLTRAEQLNLVAQLEGARDWHQASAEVLKEGAPQSFNQLQLEAAHVYASGDFSYMTHYGELNGVGDTLFEFAIREIGEADGDRDEAARMIRNAVRELEEVADHFERSMFSELTPADKPYGHPPKQSDA